ncbi:MAG: hypothetical protein M3Q64_03505 [bacterium]|nr:hypothetical protein [bacterium]
MSLESNKWLFKLNEINQEIWEFINRIGYDPEILLPANEDDEIEKDPETAGDLKEYLGILERKKQIEKKLEAALYK